MRGTMSVEIRNVYFMRTKANALDLEVNVAENAQSIT